MTKEFQNENNQNNKQSNQNNENKKNNENNKNNQNKNNSQNNQNKNKKNKKTKWTFLGSVLSLYLILSFIKPENTLKASKYSANLLLTIIPVLLLVLGFMFVFNLIDEKKLKAIIEKSPQHIQYLVMTAFGTFSHGPIYAWYPLMRDFHNKGISYGSIATFLYSRGIKLTFLPVLIAYFGLKYTVVLTIYMLIFAYIQGILVDIIIKDKELA